MLWIAASGLPVSVLCSLHPDGLVEALEGTPDGLATRFLFAWPGPPAQRGLIDDKPPREDEAVTMLHRIGGVVGTPDGEDVIAVRHLGMLALGWDHRAFDGAYAAAFLRDLKQRLETRDWAAELQ